MFFNKEKKKSSFVKAKTPEARKKQKQAIASYYAKKKTATKKENWKNPQQFRCGFHFP